MFRRACVKQVDQRRGRSLARSRVRYVEEVPGILSVKLYDAARCRSIIRQARSMNGWAKAEVGVEDDDHIYGGAVEPETRMASVLTPSTRSGIVTDFNEKMSSVIKPLVREFWHVNLKRHSDTHLVRYVPGDFYEAHTDAGLDMNDRYFTVLCYLNEGFGGGATGFPALDYSVTPRSGKAVIFPSTYLHCAEPLTKGEKYVLVSWLIGSEPTRWI
jgi:hypothetical protein